MLYGELMRKLNFRYIFKPISIFLIILIPIFHSSAPFAINYKSLIVIGLIFSMFGDIFLMFRAKYFIYGLIAFLISHFWYIGAFTHNGFPKLSVLWVGFIILGIIIYFIISKNMTKMKIPVLIYTFTIAMMAWTSTELYISTENIRFFYSAFGAVLFIVSDGVLAFNKFRRSIKNERIIVLSTYFTAQWLIAISTVS